MIRTCTWLIAASLLTSGLNAFADGQPSRGRALFRLTSQPLMTLPPLPHQTEQAPFLGEPTPHHAPYSEPAPLIPDGPIIHAGPAVPLYPCVKYKDLHKVCPNGVPIIIPVRDPHISRLKSSHGQCVYIQICVPSLCEPKIKKCWLTGTVKLDYGKYDVKIKSKRGWVYVDYGD